MGPVVVGDAPVAGVVVGVVHQVPLVAPVVLQLRQRVGQAEAQTVAEPPLQAELQAVVLRPAGVLGEPDGGEAQIGTEREVVDPRVRQLGAGLELVDVALALEVRPHPAHVGDVGRDVPGKLALEGEAPTVGRGVIEDGVLLRHDQREVPLGGPQRLIDESAKPQQQGRVVQGDPGVEDASPQSQHRLGIDLPGHAEARLEDERMGLGEPAGQAVEEPLVLRVARRGHHPIGLRREAVGGQETDRHNVQLAIAVNVRGDGLVDPVHRSQLVFDKGEAVLARVPQPANAQSLRDDRLSVRHGHDAGSLDLGRAV